ncbi:hypothetical protein EKO04_004669 [Ascochyta lentis]|uniref:PARP-type domain-containing protein n=1 Tax=Ascochyta lentis TaxID=205686 RepID=A0A8H7MID8_9PLEO|nr:hypothetical protein EKO04_004669 [Ascochyta lentis]
MGVYRVEASPNNRAGCINKECKTAGVKIKKREFRYAIQVTIKEHTSWQYKHWGCVTPKQIVNLIETSGGDTDMVDGYDELPEDYQEKVRFALENGHIPDEDWNGDVEANRDGRSGMRLTKAELKKKAKETDEDLDSEEKPKKKRGKKAPVEDDEEDDAPPPKKKGAKAAREEDAEDAPAPKKRGRPVKKETVDEEDEPAPKKARPSRGKKVEYNEEDDDEAEVSPRKKSKSRAKKAAVDSEGEAEPAEEPEEEDEIEAKTEEEAPKPKRGKKAAANGGTKATQKRKKATNDDE